MTRGPDWYAAGGHGLSEILDRLGDPEARGRALAADEASDYFRGRYVDRDAAVAAVARLVAMAVADEDEDVREAALHACLEAGEFYELPAAVFEPLVPVMAGWSAELIGYVLAMLGVTHDAAARPVIASFAGLPDPSVRREAADALVELPGRVLLCTSTHFRAYDDLPLAVNPTAEGLRGLFVSHKAICAGKKNEQGKLRDCGLPYELLASVADYVQVEALIS